MNDEDAVVVDGPGGVSRRGWFITLEGTEGCGKTSQLARIADRLRRAGQDPLVTREPGGTALGRELRRILLRPDGADVSPTAELLLYAADRAQHLAERIDPAIAEGRPVLCDRYLDATIAYQGYGRGLGSAAVLRIHELPPLDRRPDRTVLLDLDPETALRRARRRNLVQGLTDREDRFEREVLEFHRSVRQGYLELAAAEPARFRVVDAVGDLDLVERRVRRALADLLPALEVA